MTFEDFFKKKRIDLVALKVGEPALFSEFDAHFDAMGEKSFDHTKKYWFNKLRRRFPLAPEVKTEKAPIANPLAEQTITESLIETGAPTISPKVGFVPRFKAGSTPKPAENIGPAPENKPDAPSPKVGFTPRFKAGITPKPAENSEAESNVKQEITEEKMSEEKPVEITSFKPAFKPRFNAKTMGQKPPEE
jgi:hypothetical protein